MAARKATQVSSRPTTRREVSAVDLVVRRFALSAINSCSCNTNFGRAKTSRVRACDGVLSLGLGAQVSVGAPQTHALRQSGAFVLGGGGGVVAQNY